LSVSHSERSEESQMLILQYAKLKNGDSSLRSE